MAYENQAVPFIRPELESLVAQRQYLGHQLVRSQIRSFDLQTEALAVVTVREFWQDTSYQISGEYPMYDEPPAASRGPYSLEVTYTIELVADDYGPRWQVTQAIYGNQPPAWE